MRGLFLLSFFFFFYLCSSLALAVSPLMMILRSVMSLLQRAVGKCRSKGQKSRARRFSLSVPSPPRFYFLVSLLLGSPDDGPVDPPSTDRTSTDRMSATDRRRGLRSGYDSTLKTNQPYLLTDWSFSAEEEPNSILPFSPVRWESHPVVFEKHLF